MNDSDSIFPIPSGSWQNLYLHVPFCLRKCDYCAFYSVDSAAPDTVDAYLNHLEIQLQQNSPHLQALHSIYLGGGTPTVLSADQLRRMYRMIRQWTSAVPDAEITTECNPETVTPGKAEILAGFVNRVSMGVQSFSENILRGIGRRTASPERVESAVAVLQAAGLRNLGFDLIYAVPGQTLEDFRRDLETALAFGIRHLSAYSLILEEGTPLAFRTPASGEVPDDLSAEMWEFAGAFLAERGLPRYEISNYAAPESECRHNQNVWHGETYLGLGPAAASFNGQTRFTAVSDLAQWLRNVPPEYDVISAEARRREVFMMGLRTMRGWREDAGFDFPEIAGLIADGLLKKENRRIAPTVRGLLFWNDLAERLIL